MSIARSLQASVDKLREIYRRDNGDLEIFLPNILKDVEFDIKRVRELEQVLPISEELLREFRMKGGDHVQADH